MMRRASSCAYLINLNVIAIFCQLLTNGVFSSLVHQAILAGPLNVRFTTITQYFSLVNVNYIEDHFARYKISQVWSERIILLEPIRIVISAFKQQIEIVPTTFCACQISFQDKICNPSKAISVFRTFPNIFCEHVYQLKAFKVFWQKRSDVYVSENPKYTSVDHRDQYSKLL